MEETFKCDTGDREGTIAHGHQSRWSHSQWIRRWQA